MTGVEPLTAAEPDGRAAEKEEARDAKDAEMEDWVLMRAGWVDVVRATVDVDAMRCYCSRTRDSLKQ